MIEGLKVTLQGKEIVEKLRKRARWHREAARVAATKAKALETAKQKLKEQVPEAFDELEQDTLRQRVDSSRRSVSYQSQYVGHESRATYLEWVADHVVIDEQYRVGEEELRTFELIEAHGLF